MEALKGLKYWKLFAVMLAVLFFLTSFVWMMGILFPSFSWSTDVRYSQVLLWAAAAATYWPLVYIGYQDDSLDF